jgi:hypothetical protein
VLTLEWQNTIYKRTHTCTYNNQIDLFHADKNKVKCLRYRQMKRSEGSMQFMYGFHDGSLEMQDRPGAPGAYKFIKVIGVVHVELWVSCRRIQAPCVVPEAAWYGVSISCSKTGSLVSLNG